MNETTPKLHDGPRVSDSDPRFSQSRKLEAIGRLAGGVAHDFNNHLTVILGCCQLLLDKHQEDEETRRFLTEINEAGERAAQLTRQLLVFSRKQTVQPGPVNLNEIVNNLVGMLRRLITENIALRTDLGSGLPDIKADAGQLEQVIMNLVVNARDAMPRGGELKIESRTVFLEEPLRHEEEGIPPGAYVTLVVRDSGCGMGSEVLARLFEPFFTTKEPGKGTGLGLATVYAIVQQCNGHIRVASKQGAGSRFRLYFPALMESVRPERVSRGSTALPPGTGTLLLVEDDRALRQLAAQALVKSGYTVLEGRDGREALAVAAQHDGTIDLVLTDVILPFLNGPRLVSLLRSRCPAVRVVYMSGYTDSHLTDQELQDSEATLLHKPFTPALLIETIQKVMERRPLRPGPDAHSDGGL